jgi:hypothetical protein
VVERDASLSRVLLEEAAEFCWLPGKVAEFDRGCFFSRYFF